MRKVTEATATAFITNIDKKVSNTKVIIRGNTATMLLHDNVIAVKEENGTIRFNNKGFDTPTTKERLNGILTMLNEPTIYQQNFQWYRDIDGVKTEFPYSEWVIIK